jgi:uncharacterized membrane protein YdfJ with MMPL/SSD domain
VTLSYLEEKFAQHIPAADRVIATSFLEQLPYPGQRGGRSPREAAAEAVRHAGPTIAAAGLILAGSFASLMLAGQSILTQMGFAIPAGIAVAAFVMAMFFTPALTALIGWAAWWPGHAGTENVVSRARIRSLTLSWAPW